MPHNVQFSPTSGAFGVSGGGLDLAGSSQRFLDSLSRSLALESESRRGLATSVIGGLGNVGVGIANLITSRQAQPSFDIASTQLQSSFPELSLAGGLQAQLQQGAGITQPAPTPSLSNTLQLLDLFGLNQ